VTEKRVKPLMAGDLLRSPLFGLWKDREDIGDSVEFARKLRTEAEYRARRVSLNSLQQEPKEDDQ
jgi:hypothetical protein